MLLSVFSSLSDITEFISDSLLGLLFLLCGLFALFSPYDKVQRVFPKLASKKACKLGGILLAVIGLAMIILLSTDFLF